MAFSTYLLVATLLTLYLQEVLSNSNTASVTILKDFDPKSDITFTTNDKFSFRYEAVEKLKLEKEFHKIMEAAKEAENADTKNEETQDEDDKTKEGGASGDADAGDVEDVDFDEKLVAKDMAENRDAKNEELQDEDDKTKEDGESGDADVDDVDDDDVDDDDDEDEHYDEKLVTKVMAENQEAQELVKKYKDQAAYWNNKLKSVHNIEITQSNSGKDSKIILHKVKTSNDTDDLESVEFEITDASSKDTSPDLQAGDVKVHITSQEGEIFPANDFSEIAYLEFFHPDRKVMFIIRPKRD